MCNKCLELEAELIKQHNMVEKDEYNRLSKRFSKLEQHCISLEIAMQLNKEIFQKNNTSVNQTEPSFDQLFELNNLKAELQAKDTTIKKLKVQIKRVNETSTSKSVKKDFDKIETINIELEHRMTRLIAKNEHLKQTKLKGKEIADNAATISPGMYKLDPVILAPKVKNNREAHEYYLKHTMEQAAILGRDTFPDIHKPSEKLVAVTPINKKKTIRFADTVTSSGNIPKVTNRPVLSSTGVNPSTSASGSKPSGNKKNDRISRTPSNEKNKVEDQSRKVKSSLNKRNSDSKNVCNEHVKHPIKGAKALCSVCNECLFDANHAICLIDHVNKWKPVHLGDPILQLLNLLLLLSTAGTDILEITRKQPKTGKHGHEKRKNTKEAKDSRKVNYGQASVKESQTLAKKSQLTKGLILNVSFQSLQVQKFTQIVPKL
ncbi:hypothetical protein Tco_0941698 [Tanacetum coccineum]|uniref:Uncharacterized protein n=1 Tax=Tanacetum coccineum TaxID=301880 RepID=A0ABQ5DUD1_9ASTR